MTATGEQIAEALGADPFWIDPAVADRLNPALMEKATTTVEGLDFPVYVIAVDAPSVDRELLQQVKVAHGGEGAFVMINGTDGLIADQTFADTDQKIEVMDQYTNAMGEWNVSTPSTTKLNILLGYYADPQERTEAQAGTGQEVPGSEVVVDSGSGSLAPLLLGGSILVLALVIAGVWLLRRRRQGAAYRLPSRLLDRVDTLQRDSLRDSISDDTTALAESIDRLHTADLPAADADRVERALDAYQIARRIVDDTSSSRIDLAGAMVLIRQAGREIAEAQRGGRRRRGRTGSLPESLCTVNPLHGEAQSTSRVDADGQSIRVPVCRMCAEDLAAGRELQWIFDGDRPYVEARSIWARTLFGAIGGDLVTALHRERPEFDREA
ncbi:MULTISPECIES: hypothetical protein [Brevibacterium]|uniref:Uncharacterized protein n=2 Tax=Brevibacterium casei TaxID=33889 RepID=K9AGQ1_9MICO|nr:hypothetical protein [Brevibacterium casei]NJE65729.1 hypothetical protein [Brevibacterium sp. LS14]EKU46483.1 hypothetical protein C272_11293 [Brevibacterium casei S18]MCT1549194.1 hypothetical protein [Brevibacterium casei]MCT1561252.1 hypothetical protein [Brevibacterium casei]MCT2207672.1 hypothetical protein [Brevibacterium casei]